MYVRRWQLLAHIDERANVAGNQVGGFTYFLVGVLTYFQMDTHVHVYTHVILQIYCYTQSHTHSYT